MIKAKAIFLEGRTELEQAMTILPWIH